jgi:GT2 family glycosyltransferase
MPDAAIIIPHYNDVTRLARCLEALLPQLSDRTEIVVVDNGSTDDLSAVRQRFAQVPLVTEPARGAAAARNRGVAETTAPLVFFLDADCVPSPDWVATAFAACSRGDLVGGAVTVFDETPPPRSGAEAFETVFAFHNRDYIERKGFSVTANLLTRRDVFVATGPFDGAVSEDVEWCQRAVSRGYRLVYADDLRVSHPSRSDWPALTRKWQRMTRESFGVNGTGAPARLRWAGLALLMPVSVLAHVPRVLRHPGLRDSRERRAALGTLIRLRLSRMVWMLRQAVTPRA